MHFYTKTDRRLLMLNRILLALLVIIILVPMLYIVIASFMNPTTLLNQGISFNPKDWSVEGYKRLFQDNSIFRGFLNSVLYSFGFGILSVFVTMLAAYPLSIPDLMFKKTINIFFLITMFFGGGLIPTYLLIKDLGMIDTPWALILPGALSYFNVILARIYIETLPAGLIEAAKIDGANDIQIFFKIILPLCKPIMFVLFLYGFVGMWNGYFDAMIYIKNPNLEPLQIVLRKILVQNQPSMNMIGAQATTAELKRIAELIKYSTIVISSLPLIVMYPFFQKYFEKGITLGSVKE